MGLFGIIISHVAIITLTGGLIQLANFSMVIICVAIKFASINFWPRVPILTIHLIFNQDMF